MGIENRDYYRDDRGDFSWDERSRGRGWSAVTWIIVITAGCYLAQLLLGPAFTNRFLLYPPAVRNGAIWQLLTYAFLHSELSIWHIVFNMWVFHMAGSDFEARRGSKELIAFYLVAAVVAGLTTVVWETFVGQDMPALGASGAVAAVLMEFAFTHPRAKMLLFGLLPMQMMTFAVLVLMFDSVPLLLQLTGQNAGDGIAHSAHLGGLLFGILYQKQNWWISRWTPRIGDVRKAFRHQPNLRVHRPDETDHLASDGPDFERRVDALLDKVAHQGESSLTSDERELLMEASRRARGRRSQ
ncbi:MAG: rhomboid family intramembrane serine protease [Planctomycetaceae bacterium]